MDNFVNSVKRTALGVGEMLTPVLKESKFKETGVLTPEEFVVAGDHLVHHCPTWHWEKAVNAAGYVANANSTITLMFRRKDYLPAEKQFLITRRVPCHRRCLEMDYDPSLEKALKRSLNGLTTLVADHSRWGHGRGSAGRMGRYASLRYRCWSGVGCSRTGKGRQSSSLPADK